MLEKMGLKAAVTFALLHLLLVAEALNSFTMDNAAIAVSKNGMLHGTDLDLSGNAHQGLDYENVGFIMARALGVAMPEEQITQQLPTGDLLLRPKAGLMVIVNSLGASKLLQLERAAPHLYRMFYSESSNYASYYVNHDSSPSVNGYLQSLSKLVKPELEAESLPAALRRQFEHSKIVTVSSEAVVSRLLADSNSNAKVNHYTKDENSNEFVLNSKDGSDGEETNTQLYVLEESSLENELELFEKIIGNIKVADSHQPDLFILNLNVLSDLRKDQYANQIAILDTKLAAIFDKMNELYENRVFQELVLLSDVAKIPSSAAVANKRRVLSNSRLLLPEDQTPGFEGSNHQIMSWTAVVLIFMVFFVLIFVPWSTELDQLLKSGFKTD